MGAITAEFEYLWEELHDLEPTSQLGGIYAFKPGYHATRKDNQANWPGNYSITDAKDKGGPSDKAAAIDWTFPDAQQADYDTIMKYSDRLMESGKDPDDHRLDGWREFYGQCDEDTHVEGYDFRYNRTATSDPSHLWHIHLSCDRDKVTSRANMDNLLSVLRGEPVALSSDDAIKVWNTDNSIDSKGFPWRADSPAHTPPGANKGYEAETAITEAAQQAHAAAVTGSENKAAIMELAAKLDEVLAILNAGVPIPGEVNLSAESVAAVADATADELRADPERDGV